MILALLLSCADPPPEPPSPDEALVPLDAPRLLRRMSLDLRGTLPTTDELDRAEAGGEAALSALRDEILASDAFEERMVLLLAERWHTRVDELLITYVEYPAISDDATQEYAWERMIGEEPLRLMAHVAASDRPWTEIVTADYTVANAMMGALWPVDYPDDGEGWEVARYTDGRPAAGVLATNGLWWRYYTTVSNYNRGRAAAIARLLLCEDYLSRPVSFDGQVSLVDEEGIESALRANPYCVGCHSAIDPLASALFGFWVANEYSATEMERYHPEREQLGRTLLETPPTYFGAPTSGLAELGQQIAQDPRFQRCAVETFASLLWGRELDVDDYDRVEALRLGWAETDGSLKPLLSRITDTPVYQAGALAGASAAQEEAENTTRLMDATLLRSVYADLAGFSWTYEGWDMLDNDTYGYRVLGGGVDGSSVTSRQRTPSVTWTLTAQRAAEAAATTLAAGLENEAFEYRIFTSATIDALPGDAAFDAELDALRWRLHGRRADATWREETAALWSAVYAAAGAREAWIATLGAMLQDPEFLTY